MYFRKPKFRNAAGKVIPEDDLNWATMKGDYVAPEVQPRKVIQGKNAAGREVITYSGFPVDTLWGSLQQFFEKNNLGNSYLTAMEKSGRKVHKNGNGLVIHANGTTNLCTVQPWREFRVRKIEAVKPQFHSEHHQYDITIYYEKPVSVLLDEFWHKRRRFWIKFSRAVAGSVKGAVRGWKSGWWSY